MKRFVMNFELTFMVNTKVLETLDKLSEKHNLSRAAIMRKALALLDYADDCIQSGDKLSLINDEGCVICDINVFEQT